VSGSYDRTVEFYRHSLEKARDANDWTSASRSLGQAAFAADTFTEISWAGVELSQRQCPQAKNHLDKAAQKLSTAPVPGRGPPVPVPAERAPQVVRGHLPSAMRVVCGTVAAR
jgi:hypothetical protein